MPLPTFKSLDEIPEPFRPEYEERDGAWHPKVEDVTPLKQKNAELLTETKAERKKRQELEAKVAELEEQQAAKKAGIPDAKLEEIKRQAEEKYRPVHEELEKTRAKLRQMQLDGSVKAMLAKADVIDVDAAWKIVGDGFDLTDEGSPILKSDPTADLEKHITGTLRKQYPFLFKGTQAAGGGAAGQTGGNGATAGSKPVTRWSSEERASYIEEHGQEAYRGLLDTYLRDASKPKATA